MSVFDKIKASGLEYEHDMGSLLVPVCAASDDMLRGYPVEVWPFKGADKALWYEVPAGYDPWFSQDGEDEAAKGDNANAGTERVPFAAW